MTLLKDDPSWVGCYRLESRLGSGGMGVVYRAYSESGQAVALKVIRRQWVEDREFRARFELEVAAARMVHSEHTAPIIDADPYAPNPWMASLYIPGESLAVRVQEHGPLGGQELRLLAQALGGALRDIHRAGVVHRDLKPGNVLLSERGPLIMDFGVSRAVDGMPLTAAGQVVGTPAFMAPEQFTSTSEAGPAADVFSLGCVLAFAATGRSPFEAGSPYASAHLSMHEEPDLSALPDALQPLVAACLRKTPAERLTPDELLLALVSSEPKRTTARRAGVDTLRTVAARWLNRRVPAWLMALTVLASAATGIGTVALWPSTPASSPTARHTQEDWSPWETRLTGNGGIQRCTASDEVIYCVTGDGSIARINTLDDGRIAWTSAVPADRYANFTPPRGGTVVLGVAHGMVFTVRERARTLPDDGWEPLRSRLYALDADTGRTLWSRLLPDIAFPEVPLFQVVQLVRGQQTLYITDPVKNEIVAVNVATRSTRWKRPLRTGETLAATPDGLYALQTPTKRGQHPRRTAITTIEPATGHTAWTTTKNGTLDFAASVPGALYLAERTSRVNGEARHTAVMRLDTRTRADVRVPVPGGFRCRFAPSITQGATDHYGVADGSTFYLEGDTGETIVVNTQSKSTRRHREPDTTGTFALPTLLDNQLLYSTSYGEVIATNTHRGEQLWRTHRRTAATKRPRPPLSPVMVVNGKLYAVSARSSVFTIDASP
ncbi:outer membrane protein assembly factor BamB [Streptomyces phaeochromogenes]|uniref:serine/threonine-protein kinase n=1 Tax=Streptomyces phaeochromogenes TaxID=1923 RepID=UPI00278E901E|nr:PQQ-binding-like beta-propeller repeat protein [Streptomyces phaeochromogenes]MDQ0955962.1 outer membrane protein assembly factor BamB [Streptomyces phaeochromogenes]